MAHGAVVNQASKENVAAKKAYTEALRARQKNEEFTNFTREQSPGFEIESEDEDDDQPVSLLEVLHIFTKT
jgi:hypothetical protein